MSQTTHENTSNPTALRTPIVAVVGHVDAGKTSFLDKIRSSNVAGKEAGAITQHIGATEVPIDVINTIAGDMAKKFGFKLSIPGLLFIDTPGHEAFTNLRERGSSIADLAVLVVDIHKGLQAQTKESISILKQYKVPFLVCANKIDTLDAYQSQPGSFLQNQENQSEKAKKLLDDKLYQLVGQLFEAGFQSERFDRVQDTTKEVAIVPACVRTGEGLPEVLVFLAGLSQKFLEKNLKLETNGPARGTCLEVREEKGLGTTLDVILYDGVLRTGDTFVVAGKNGVVRSKVRALLQPNTLTDIRSAEKFISIKEVHAATGVKISAPNLETALAGSPFLVEKTGNEEKEIESEVNRIKITGETHGVILRADTLGSLEALVKMLQNHSIKIRHADVGDVTRRDVMEAAAVKTKEPLSGVILAFNVEASDVVQKDALAAGVVLFESKIVYSLLEEYTSWKKQQEDAKDSKLLEQAIFPVELKVLPNFVFRKSKPAVVGVRIEKGRLKKGTELLNKKNEVIGTVKAIQSENDDVELAETGKEVAISIDHAIVEKNLFEKDVLHARITPSMAAILQQIEKKLSAEEKEMLSHITASHSSIEEHDGRNES